ncbi:MAG: ferrous iron transport protein A [Clostridiales bacterium]|nr:ferrous iron transport protein A [Clostridiales bacterium]
MEITADKLKTGQEGTVRSLACTGALRRRIIDMGITPGASIRLIRKAPLGDPMEYNVRGYELSVRRSEAKEIMVEVH